MCLCLLEVQGLPNGHGPPFLSMIVDHLLNVLGFIYHWCLLSRLMDFADRAAAIMSLSLASGLGSILNVFFALYSQQGHGTEDITRLLTVPSLCIGLGEF